jgi:hypothetical protein
MFEDATAKKCMVFFIHKTCTNVFDFLVDLFEVSIPSRELPDHCASFASLGVDSGKFFKGGFWGFFLFLYVIQHCVICHPSESAVSEDAGLNPGLLQG